MAPSNNSTSGLSGTFGASTPAPIEGLARNGEPLDANQNGVHDTVEREAALSGLDLLGAPQEPAVAPEDPATAPVDPETPPGAPNEPEAPAEPVPSGLPEGFSKVKVVGPFHITQITLSTDEESILVVTREGTIVPTENVDKIIAAAALSGVSLEASN